MRRPTLLTASLARALLLCSCGAALGVPRVAAAQQAGSSLNFVDMPVTEVIRALAGLLNLTVVLSDVPAKRITFTTSGPVTRADVSGILESILESQNLVLVKRGLIAEVMPSDRAPATGQVFSGTTISDPPPLGLVTQLVPLQSMRAEESIAALRQIASPTARIEAVPRSNAVIITDRGRHVARYLELLRGLDERPAGDLGLQTYVVPLQFSVAEDIAQSLGQLFGIAVGTERGESLGDRSLGRALDAFRRRDQESFRIRNDNLPQTAPPAGSTSVNAARDSAARGVLVGQTTVVAHGPTNALVVRTAPANFSLLRETIAALDVRPAQVLLEVTVAEVTLGRGMEWGIDWTAVTGGRESVEVGRGSVTRTDTTGQHFVLRLVSLRGTTVRAVLDAVASRSNVRVLSTPEILATNNRQARIMVGSKVPFVASTRLGNDIAIDRSVQYQDVGTTLTIVPTINANDYVSVELLQEVSTLTTQTVAAALNAPVISTREASTRALLRDGQTVVIGGLMGSAQEKTFSGVPILMDIPVLGGLFRRDARTTTRTELAIFVTPHIVRSDAAADVIRERTRARLNDQAPALLPPLPAPVP